MIVETEAYSQEEEACHGYRRCTSSNKTLFGDPGRLYVYMTYGIYHCVNIVTGRRNWANGVLLRAAAFPGKDERLASGPGLLARSFGLNKTHDNLELSIENGIWMVDNSLKENMQQITASTRIGISHAKDLPWRWYLKNSRSVSKRAKGDLTPKINDSWKPYLSNGP